MSVNWSGVQAVVRQDPIPNEIYTHCYAHRLNLVIADVSKVVEYVNEFYEIVSKVR